MRFFCARKGCDGLKNKVFMLKTDEERRSYLSGVLKHAAGGAIKGEMIECILHVVALQRQYAVSVLYESRLFHDAVAAAQNGANALAIITSCGRPERSPVVAVITPPDTDRNGSAMRLILIYKPKPQKRKGEKTWAKTTKTASRSRR